MNKLILYPLLALIGFSYSACDQVRTKQETQAEPQEEAMDPEPEKVFSPTLSVVRVHSTRQAWNPSQPWEKLAPKRRSSLGTVVGEKQVITTAEMVADATNIELETADGLQLIQARVQAVDYDANLALLHSEDERAEDFFSQLQAVSPAPPQTAESKVNVVQLQDNGEAIFTSGRIRSIEVQSSYLPGSYFLTYKLKASMQTAGSSYTLPAFKDGELVGLVTSYDSEDQICDITASPIIQLFLEDAADGEYLGFPSLGIAVSSTEDQKFRDWLKLPDDAGGLYISKIRPKSPAEKSGVKVGDVLTSINDSKINRQGYYTDPIYGKLFWSHLINGQFSVGSEIALHILRNGEQHELTATLEYLDDSQILVPLHNHSAPPPYLVKGGFVFQELSLPLLRSFGKNWENTAPLELLDPFLNPYQYQERMERVSVVIGAIPTAATMGYEGIRNQIISKVNDSEIHSFEDLAEAMKKPDDRGYFEIHFEGQEFPIYLDSTLSDHADADLLRRGLPRLSRVKSKDSKE